MATHPANAAPIVADKLTAADLRAALSAGLRDFLACPLYGLFFGAIYVVTGLAVAYALFWRGEAGWLVPVTAGFPLIAPFAAVGLYEVSRRRELGEPIGWGSVFGALRGRGDEQLLMMGGFVFVAFSFWVIIAHAIFSIFMAESMGGESLAVFQTQAGLWMLAVGTAVGALLAWGFYCITVISLPMLVDRDVDFITAIIASIRVVRANTGVMLAWAMIIAASLFAAMIPLFIGLLIVLPVLGHATWHLYRRTITASP
ncbi:DUF2189 domain-containing protein [Aurantiacibacter odishensis]|uniref:DUF2189 domain-containing protein n=1 Tax=Aurantiacibacter odishensis TaxID=1155476 RepID=UPI000E719CD0|nr:DUF2189 domain-containing protein [Aurantiacibacter odishensis]